MKPLFTRRQLGLPWRMRLALALLAGGIFLASGCGKHPAADKTADAGPGSHTAAEPASPSQPGSRVVPVMVAESADDTAKLAQLTQVLRRYGVEHRRVPQSLNEVIAAGYLAAVPVAPPGKQFGIDQKHMQVVLENR